jgi:nucleotide-binding universal stress UspA family protein
MRILHPTDFSRTAELAQGLAHDLAARAHATLHLVHVQERFEEEAARRYLPAQTERISAEFQRRLAEDRAEETRHIRERLANLAGTATSELVWGNTLPELLRLANEHDLVVMGAHGANPFDDVFLGGVAGRLVRRTTTPVLTVRQKCTRTQVKRLLVATDFEEASMAAWTFALHLAKAAKLKLVLAHVDEDKRGDAKVPAARLEALSAGRAERCLVRAGHPVDTLPALADEVGADAIVVGMRRHRAIAGLLMGARADALIRSSAVPILSVPAT